jgi:translation initiation factor IF-3
VVSLSVALERAKDASIDLVEVSPESKPPVCRLMDFKRHRYEQSKKQKDNKKKTPASQLKQIRLSPNIGKHDLQVKFKMIKRFLEKGHRVKVNMMFRGREKEHLEVGKEILYAIIGQLDNVATCLEEPKYEGYYMSILLVPGKRGE